MNIREGDLVIIFKPTICCNNSSGIGAIFAIKTIGHLNKRCPYCEIMERDVHLAIYDGGGCELTRLKKIPPISETESVNRIESVPA